MRIKRNLITAGVAVSLLFGGSSAAFAATQYPAEGGTWQYGLDTWTPTASSSYQVGRCHGSTAKTSYGEVRSVNTAANSWSRASKAANYWGNSYYYRVC
ncbi:lactococcin 972 family bacteriocin [Kocuria tytonis]|uniref:Lactococcin 972 family bacteriocin n=1 Tax=Kocuria tytonis TaxID=2054280 RepID=A0A495A601_9MICC|nr:hypothetical protein C1C97_007655 [Kocuria tytonis]